MAIIRGKVTDLNKTPIPNVHVFIKEKPLTGVITDAFGNFNIDMALNQNLTFSHVGYENYTETITNTTPKQIVLLEDSANSLPSVTITPTTKNKGFNWLWLLLPLAGLGIYAASKKNVQPKKIKV